MKTLHGKVIFVGAGPGDPELLTLKAVRALQQADVVLCDRLVNTSVTAEYAPQAVVITVGKQGRNDKSIKQEEISAIICHHALEGRNVVRLKGGDCSVFSNIAHELDALLEHNLAFEIIPGITAASGLSAAANMPLTAREFAQGVRILTYYNTAAVAQTEWSKLAHCGDTLVFYMSGAASLKVAQQLLDAGMMGDTPVMMAENVTMPGQKFTVSSICNCISDWKEKQFASPALFVVGSCVQLYTKHMHNHFPSRQPEGNWHSLLTPTHVIANTQTLSQHA